jgi:deoxycytidylate deaminase
MSETPRAQPTQFIEMTSSADASAKVFIYKRKPTPKEITAGRLLLLDTIDGKFVYIAQVELSDRLVIEYGDHDTYFDILVAAVENTFNQRANQHYLSKRITGSLVENRGKVIGYETQDINAHKFTVGTDTLSSLIEFGLTGDDAQIINAKVAETEQAMCVREAGKNVAADVSDPSIPRRSDFYNLCPGCSYTNHSEAQTVAKLTQDGKYEDLKDSTVYLYGHWWCCKPCSDKLADSGVNKVIISRKWAREYLKIDDLLK